MSLHTENLCKSYPTRGGELAVLRGVSRRTVQRDWLRARLLLHRLLQD
jgi:hypothetical protein